MNKLRLLHLEDNPADAALVRAVLQRSGLDFDMVLTVSGGMFESEIQKSCPGLILADSGIPGFSGMEALALARTRCPGIPFIFVSGSTDPAEEAARMAAGATACIPKGEWKRLAEMIRALSSTAPAAPTAPTAPAEDGEGARLQRHNRAMMRLVAAVQELSLARSLQAVMEAVRRAARELTGADGATFVLRDGDKCHYADEDAIAPLWKGHRFPMSACISGWAMLNKQSVAIEDIYADERIPADAYRPTFVKSLVMVPIRTGAPIGAIGSYWANHHRATPEEIELLQALANTTSVAMESVQLYAELEQRVQERTVQLEAANRELEAFSYSVSHDLQAPLRAIGGFTHLIAEDCADRLDERGRDYFRRVIGESERMRALIGDLLRLAQFAKAELKPSRVSLSAIARETAERLRGSSPGRRAAFFIADGAEARADEGLMRVVIENLLSNAWKYSSRREDAVIEFGAETLADGTRVFVVRDNGAGFDMRRAEKLFAPFQRLHSTEEFAGTGIGLATVQRIIHRHGGTIRAEAEPGVGASFFFTLPADAIRGNFPASPV